MKSPIEVIKEKANEAVELRRMSAGNAIEVWKSYENVAVSNAHLLAEAVLEMVAYLEEKSVYEATKFRAEAVLASVADKLSASKG